MYTAVVLKVESGVIDKIRITEKKNREDQEEQKNAYGIR